MTGQMVWPAERWPSPDEWREWFLSLDAPAQYDVAARVVSIAQGAASCTHSHVSLDAAAADARASYCRGWSDGSAGRREARAEYTAEEHGR